MASYYDPDEYDPRSRATRTTKHETLDFPREDARSRVRNTSRDDRYHREGDLRSSQPKSATRERHDSRYHFPLSSTEPRRQAAGPPRSPNKRRFPWPPQPMCEDEVVSLRREAGSVQLLKDIRKNEIPARGQVDQEVLIEYAPDWINEHEKRFVLLPKSERGSQDGMPTPPTSEDEKRRKLRRHSSRIGTGQKDQVPEMSKRTSSPYTFNPSKPSKDNFFAPERFLSPDTLTPPPQDQAKKHHRSNTASGLPSPRRDSGRLSPSGGKRYDYFPSTQRRDEDTAIDDSASDTKHAGRERNRRYSAKQSSEPQPTTSRISVTDFAPSATSVPSVRKANLDARRSNNPASAVPSLPQNVEKGRRPSPLTSTFSQSDLRAPMPSPSQEDGLRPHRGGSNGMSNSSRNVSPAPDTARYERSPQRPASYGSVKSVDSADESSRTSRSGSVAGSRPSSPSPRIPGDSPRLPKTDVDWSGLMAANTARRGKPPSRLSTSMRQESIPEVPRAASDMSGSLQTPSTKPSPLRPSFSAGLPYPEDDILTRSPSVYMPSEKEYLQPRPPVAGLSASISRDSRVTGLRGSSPSTPSTTQPPRPSLSQRHSDMYVSSNDGPSKASASQRSIELSSQTRKELASLMKKGLPDCSRPKPVAGEDEWYTVIGAPQLVMCPECSDIFERTVFRSEIRLAPPRDLSEQVQCNMGSSKWIQLAWLLTLQLQRTNLALLKDVASIDETSDPCPGINEGMRSWYGLRDSEGAFIKNFQVCFSDVRKIERLLPTLCGMFVRMPQSATNEKYRCALGNTAGDRFEAYLEGLIMTHERALSSRKGADSGPLLDLIKRKNRFPECRRDLMFAGAFWHYMPTLPALTVCEDCFESLVEPEIATRSSLASRFQRTVQPVYGEGVGSSCQLYSPYMRQVFARAIRNNDYEYLASRAKRRRDAELRLQARWKDIDRKVRRLSRVPSNEVDNERHRLQKEIDRIAHEWKTQWE